MLSEPSLSEPTFIRVRITNLFIHNLLYRLYLNFKSPLFFFVKFEVESLDYINVPSNLNNNENTPIVRYKFSFYSIVTEI